MSALRTHTERVLLTALCLTLPAVVFLATGPTILPAQEPSVRRGAPKDSETNANDKTAAYLEQLRENLKASEKQLASLLKQHGAQHPELAAARAQRDALLAAIAGLEKMNAIPDFESQSIHDEKSTGRIEETRARELTAQFEAIRAQLEEREKQLADMAKHLAERERAMAEHLAERERNRQLPPIKDGRVVVFKPKRLSAAAAAEAIESLLGSQTVRLAADEKTNALIAFGKEDALAAVQELVGRLDEQADASKEAGAPATVAGATEAPKSLLLRVFWLADGLPEDEGQDPAAFLPQGVLKATERLGLTSPRLVAQTVNSLAANGEEAISFNTAVPAVISKMPVGLSCDGRVKLVQDNRIRVEINLNVGGPVSCSLSGSLASPLGHYMVLGTANSVVSDAALAGQPGMMGGGYGMEGGMMGRGGYGAMGRGGYGEMGRGGYGGESGRGYGGMRGEGGYGRDEAAEMERADPAAADGAKSQPAAPSFTTSRFAFVVQAIEGESYPAEQ